MQRMRSVAAAVHEIYHDNLIYVERFEPHDGIFVMDMRLIDGYDLQRLLEPEVVRTLEQFVRTVRPDRWETLKEVVFAHCANGLWGLTPGVAVNIIEKCLRGVSALHDKGIVHCDIKKSNIMLDCQGSIRLIDIGSAFQLGARPKPHAWSPRYAPPEVLEDDAWTPKGDLASLGYVLIELLTGRPDLMGPFASSESVHFLDRETRTELAKAKRQLFDRLEHLIPVKVRDSESLIVLCKMLIHPDPAKRFASAEDAFDWTAKFKDELVVAKLAMPWVKVIKYWLADTKKAMCWAGTRA
jgi:eukaryotic-like serine/threonine-protein kinase